MQIQNSAWQCPLCAAPVAKLLPYNRCHIPTYPYGYVTRLVCKYIVCKYIGIYILMHILNHFVHIEKEHKCLPAIDFTIPQ